MLVVHIALELALLLLKLELLLQFLVLGLEDEALVDLAQLLLQILNCVQRVLGLQLLLGVLLPEERALLCLLVLLLRLAELGQRVQLQA